MNGYEVMRQALSLLRAWRDDDVASIYEVIYGEDDGYSVFCLLMLLDQVLLDECAANGLPDPDHVLDARIEQLALEVAVTT